MIFPGTAALDDVSINFLTNEVHGLIGENGAGKSTFVKILAGILVPTLGEIKKDDENVYFETPAAALKLGIAYVSQEGSLVPQFSGAENIMLGAEPRGKIGIISKLKIREEASQLLTKWFPKLNIDLNIPVSKLSIADRKVIEIIRAMRGDINLLILDEPTASLEESEKKQLWEIIQQLPKSGIGVVLISHFLSEIVYLSDKISVLRDGKHVKTLRANSANELKLTELMLERKNAFEVKRENQFFGNRIDFNYANISVFNWKVSTISVPNLQVHAGEILGLIGLTGAGHFGFAHSLYTRAEVTSGNLYLNGNEVLNKNIYAMQQAGVAFIPNDRMENSLNGSGSLNENLATVHAHFAAKYGIISKRKDHDEADFVINKLNIKAPNRRQIINNLSGGNKQKVSIGKWVYGANDRYNVYIFVEPTEGVDVGAKQEIYANMFAQTEAGASVIIASSDLGEIARVCDRVIPFNNGHSGNEILAADFSEAKFIRAISESKNA